MYTFALLAINLDTAPNFLYFFQPASLASFLFRNFQFIYILVVGSLLSTLDLCKHPKYKNPSAEAPQPDSTHTGLPKGTLAWIYIRW